MRALYNGEIEHYTGMRLGHYTCHGSSIIVIIFTIGKWSMAAVCFFKVMIMMHCDFDTRSLKVNIFNVLFWEGGGGHGKEYSVYAFDNVVILDGPYGVCIIHLFPLSRPCMSSVAGPSPGLP